MTTAELPVHGPLTREEERAMRIYYVIYSMDTTASGGRHLRHANPNLISGFQSRSLWTETEGDEQYDYGYLADEGADESEYRDGHHRKWVAELTHEEFLMLCDDRGIDLDEDERPVRYDETMGSITELGRLPAYCVHDHKGWEDYGVGHVIDAQFYISEGCLPMSACEPIRERTTDANPD